ncbi:MAG: flavodoxin family protein [Candidatus Sumerlaeota bacterium]|nr:flavodoxin family protein [Candidatus Sumerlaeota bacterium]
MKIISIQGSPRKSGNTATVLGWAEEELSAKGHQIQRFNVAEMNIKGCVECFRCKSSRLEDLCALKDDGQTILKQILAADAIILASPLFCWEFSSQIKPLIDRLFCMVTEYSDESHVSLIEGKRLSLLVTAAGPIEENADLIIQAFRRLAGYLKTPIAGQLVVPNCGNPEDLGEEAKKQAVALAHAIIHGGD